MISRLFSECFKLDGKGARSTSKDRWVSGLETTRDHKYRPTASLLIQIMKKESIENLKLSETTEQFSKV